MSGGSFEVDPSWPTILELATKLWGQPTGWSHNKNEARFGARGSKSIKLKEMTWFDNEENKGGGYIGIYGKLYPGQPLPPRTGIPRPTPATPKPNGATHAKTNGKANGRAHDPDKPEIWNNVGPIQYNYHDASGAMVLQVFRTITGDPRFGQRAPDGTYRDGKPKWKYKVRHVPGHESMLYRFPALLASGQKTVWICEGEKDTDRLARLGLVATTNISGAGKWRAENARHFLGKPVVILADNDPQSTHQVTRAPLFHPDGRPIRVGQDHAESVARALHGVASSVKVLMLPDLPVKGDVSDWLEAGGTVADLERLARDLDEWVPPPAPEIEAEEDEDEPPAGWNNIPPPPTGPGGGGGPGGAPGKPVITCIAGELPRMVRQAEAALLRDGTPIYQRSVLVRPADQEYPAADGSLTHSAALVQITNAAMLGMLANAADWLKYDGRKKSFVPCDPPPKVVEILLANRGQWSFPVVRGVLTTPTIRPDGSLLMTPGYDPVSRYYLMFPSSLTLPEIPDVPAARDASDALGRLEALLTGYEFVDDEGVSRSVALAILMTQVLRCGMAVSPLLAVSATAPGSGKSHLIDLASTIAIGRPCPIMGAGKNDEETEKGINTHLISGVAGFSIDNVHRMVDLAVLNIATERPMIGIRLFGTLDRVEVENAVTIYMTGNNLPVIDEQVRRTVLCSVDAGVEQPEQRNFEGQDPIATVLANRGRYIADILIIARAYLAHGSKRDDMKPFGSYPGWSKLVREPLIWLGHPDPVASQNSTRASDPEMNRLRSLMAAWLEAFGLDTPTTLSDAARYALEQQPMFHGDPYNATRDAELMKQHLEAWAPHTRLKDVLTETWGKGKDVDTGRFGNWLRKYAGRVVDGMLFQKGDAVHSAAQWKLVKRGGRGGQGGSSTVGA